MSDTTSPSGNQIICVLGMHRSGTSLIARVLNLMGLYLGPSEHLMPPNEFNPKGYWEHQPIVDLNEEILKRLGGSWREPPVLPPGWEGSPEFADLRQRARKVVEADFATASCWGWKDPRTCLTLPFWKRLLPPLKYVICLRNPADVAKSLETRETREQEAHLMNSANVVKSLAINMPVEKGIDLWHQYTNSAIEYSSGQPRIFIFYEDLMEHWREETHRLAQLVAGQADQPVESIFDAIEKLVDEGLHHHRTSLLDLVDDARLSFPAKALYMSLRLAVGLNGVTGQNPNERQLHGAVNAFNRHALAASEARVRLENDLAVYQRKTADLELAAESAGEARLAADRQRTADLEAAARELANRDAVLHDTRMKLEAQAEQLTAFVSKLELIIREAERHRLDLFESEHEAKNLLDALEHAVHASADRDAHVHTLEGQLQEQSARLGVVESNLQHLLQRTEATYAAVGELPKSVSYSRLKDRIQEVVCATILPGATVIVVSRGDGEFLRFAGRTGWHFPQADSGVYAGHYPSDSSGAIAHLETLRLKGGQFFLFPSTAFWWLKHYEAFRSYLDARYTLTWSGDECIIYDLSGSRKTNRLASRLGGLSKLPRQPFSWAFPRRPGTEVEQERSSQAASVEAIVSEVSSKLDRPRQYHELVPCIRRIAEQLVPSGATVIVVSKGDDELLKFDGRPGWHFPRAAYGLYGGCYPADSAAAIGHLEELRAKGGDFLLFPSTAFWWLDHYVELKRHLESRYRMLTETEEACLLFSLREPAPEGQKIHLHRVFQPERRRWKTYAGCLPIKAGAKNVLIVAHVAAVKLFGGERSLLDILNALRTLRYNVFVIVPQDETTYVKALRKASVEVAILQYGWWRDKPGVDEDAIRDFMAYYEQRAIDLVHVNTIVIRDALEAARRMSIPSMVHVREIITGDATLVTGMGMSAKRIVEDTLRSADYVIANSEATASVFDKPRSTFIVPNGVDVGLLDIPNEIDPNDIRIGLISSNIAKKGVEDFVQLASACSERIHNLRFLLIGPETEETQTLRMRQLAGQIPTNLEFAGYQDEPSTAITMVNIVANFSRFEESFGRTIIEGMAARRPVIVYDNGNPPKLVDHGQTGFVVPYPDWKAAIPHLCRLCEQPDLISTMGAEARRFAVENYSLQILAEKLDDAYHAALTPRNPSDWQEGGDLPEQPTSYQVRPARLNLRRAQDFEGALRIAYFCWHFPVPSETFVLNELRELVHRGCDVRVFCRESPHPDFVPDFPIEWERVDAPETLARRLKETSRDLVHAHFTYPTVTEMVWPACQQANIPFTFIAHAQDIFKYENDKKNRIAEIVASDACRYVFVPGRFHQAFLLQRGVPARKIVINSQAIDSTLFRDPNPVDRRVRRTKKICAVQRFVRKKGLDDLVRAGQLCGAHELAIDIYGYGPDEDRLRAIIEDERISNVKLCGPVRGRDALIQVLRGYDLFACPSLRTDDGDMDGIPTALMEAMALGLPVLTTPIASIPDLVRDRVTGLLCEPNDPESVATAIRSFYDMPPAMVQAMVDNAHSTVTREYDSARKTRRLRRLWRNDMVDLIIVSWNNVRQLREVIRRVYEYTRMPFHLIVCDNNSDQEVVEFLNDLWEREDNVTVVHRGFNSFVGPGTNTALEHGRSKYGIYLCGKEALALRHGWEQDLVDYMEEHDDVGLAGTLGYSPSYFNGRDYIDNIAVFPQFRNQEFAKNNPGRKFRHVQGGLFILRRKMFEEIGGFSEIVSHKHTDVEYSYYVESCGWKLGAIDTMLALYDKTRPDIMSRIDEGVRIVHPASLEVLPLLDSIAEERTRFCNLCGWSGDAFGGSPGWEICPACGSGPPQRTLFRYLAESTLTYRRLRALSIDTHPSIEAIWRTSFQGRLLSRADVLHEIEARGQLDSATGGTDVVHLDDALGYGTFDVTLLNEISRILSPDGTLLVRNQYDMGVVENDERALTYEDLRVVLSTSGFEIESETLYGSAVVRYDWLKLLTVRKCDA